MRPEGRYDSHESSNDHDGLEMVIRVEHILDKQTYLANDAC